MKVFVQGNEIKSHSPLEGLWPNMPLKKQGIRIDPPMSDPMPRAEPAAANKHPCNTINTYRETSLQIVNLTTGVMNEGSSGEEEIRYEEREDTRVRHAMTLQCVGSLLHLDYVEQWDFNYSDIVTLRNIRTVFYKKEYKCTSKAKEHTGN